MLHVADVSFSLPLARNLAFLLHLDLHEAELNYSVGEDHHLATPMSKSSSGTHSFLVESNLRYTLSHGDMTCLQLPCRYMSSI